MAVPWVVQVRSDKEQRDHAVDLRAVKSEAGAFLTSKHPCLAAVLLAAVAPLWRGRQRPPGRLRRRHRLADSDRHHKRHGADGGVEVPGGVGQREGRDKGLGRQEVRNEARSDNAHSAHARPLTPVSVHSICLSAVGLGIVAGGGFV